MRVLHVLSQRPGLTGSGVTLDALVREAAGAGWEQAVVVGTPASDPAPRVGRLPAASVHPVCFGTPPLAFPLPGMSDVMPYESSRWQDLRESELATYRAVWRTHLADVIERFRPDVIHGHHLWLVSALLKDVAPDLPVVAQSHATGLRQMALCPHLADEVRRGCRQCDRILALTTELKGRIVQAIDVPAAQVSVVGAGFRDDCFHARGRDPESAGQVLYAGKYSRAKGLPWLLDAVQRLPSVTLHVAGGGQGEEADALRARMEAMAPRVVLHGQLEQPALADLLRQSAVFVLPSLYEGLPLVLVEAVACGCRAVATDLPAVREDLAPRLEDALDLVRAPRLAAVDEPDPADLPRFVADLERAIAAAVVRGPLDSPPTTLDAFTWASVFARVERTWREVRGAH